MSQMNPRFPHRCVITRGTFDQFADTQEQGTTTIYNGACRNYQKEYVKTTGNVMQSIRCTALPIKNTEWTESTLPHENDWIVAYNNGYQERGIIIDKQPNNFGTDIYWTYERN